MEEQRTTIAIQVGPTDAVQREIKEIIKVEVEVSLPSASNTAEVEAQRRQQVHALFDGAERVDLVGHSTPIKRYLKLDGWVLDPREAEILASYMPASVKTVRLIGCATATKEGGKALEAFTRSGLSAYGTLNKVYTTHFDKQGVKPRGNGEPGLRGFLPRDLERPSPPATRPATEASSPPAAEASSPPVSRTYAPDLAATHRARLTVPRPLAWLGRCLWWVNATPFAMLRWLSLRLFATHEAPHRWILRLLRVRSIAMPGLLTEPLLTFEIASGGKTWSLEILFDYEYARFYSSADSAARRDRVYEIRGFGRVAKTLLEAYLEAAPRGIKLIRRHEEAGERGGVLVQR